MAKKNPDPVDKKAGARLRMRRLSLGLSQTKLAKTIGISFQQVQKYERGTNRMSSSRLQQIANVLEVPVAFFFDEHGSGSKHPGNTPDYISKFLEMREGHALARYFVTIKSSKLRYDLVKLAASKAKKAGTGS